MQRRRSRVYLVLLCRICGLYHNIMYMKLLPPIDAFYENCPIRKLRTTTACYTQRTRNSTCCEPRVSSNIICHFTTTSPALGRIFYQQWFFQKQRKIKPARGVCCCCPLPSSTYDSSSSSIHRQKPPNKQHKTKPARNPKSVPRNNTEKM